MSNRKRKYNYVENSSTDRDFHIQKGQYVSGHTIGILHLKVWYPLIPGNVVNAETFDFPIRYKLIPDATQEKVHSGDPTLIENIVQAGEELERQGVRAICGACGYLGNYQNKISDVLNVPVYLSSLVQGPIIQQGMKQSEKIGVLCADKENLTSELFANCGITNLDDYVIKGIGDKPNFSAILKSDRGHFNNEEIKKEIVNSAQDLTDNNNIGAILLECSDMPPYAAEIQKTLELPVYDFITMINWVHHSVSQKPYKGNV